MTLMIKFSIIKILKNEIQQIIFKVYQVIPMIIIDNLCYDLFPSDTSMGRYPKYYKKGV